MKKVFVTVLLLILCLSILSVGSAALSMDPDSKPIATLQEYREMEERKPPKTGIYWDDFSVLGGYTPVYYPHYYYLNDTHEYRLSITDLSTEYDYHLQECDGIRYSPEEWDSLADFWEKYYDDIDEYSAKQFLDITWKRIGRDYVLVDPNKAPGGDLTKLEVLDDNSCYATYLNGKLVYDYTDYGLIGIEWIHNGLLYELHLDVEGGLENRYDPFGENDIDLIRRLTNINTCEAALNELMAQVSDNAVSEMPSGMETPKPNLVLSVWEYILIGVIAFFAVWVLLILIFQRKKKKV